MKLCLNIKFRLTLWYLFITAVILAFFSIITYTMLSDSLNKIARSPANLSIVEPQEATDGNTPSTPPEQPVAIISYTISAEWMERLQSGAASTLSIFTPQGQIVIDQKDFISFGMSGEQQVQLLWRSSSGEPGAYEILAVVQPASGVNDTLAAFRRVLAYVIPITVFPAAGLGFLLVWRMLRPVNAITRTATEIGEGDLSQRIDVPDNNDELGNLASTLNRTFDRLHRAFSRERQFTSDASHELRTPLSIMRGEASLALARERSPEEYRKSLETISREIDHLSSTVDKLLTLTRTDSGKQQLKPEIIDLDGFLLDFAEDVKVLCEENSLGFELKIEENAVVEGDRVKLRELFLNLLDNAVRYTPSGGTITMTLYRERDSARVAVKDSGIGIPPEHLPHIFERFYRVDKASLWSTKGAGLGLSISQSIAELHGGKIEVESLAGVGSTFTVILPVKKL
ncbi:MAG: HAMP domain-containing protein [Dehalococcoidales bacterium]|nr:HAMP domain-containing protein [Dehalococcoidales bacterium]